MAQQKYGTPRDHIRRIEKRVRQWFRLLPRLPREVLDWLCANLWWLVVLFIAVIGVDAIGSFAVVLNNIFFVKTSSTALYYNSTMFLVFSTIRALASFIFSIIELCLLAFSIQPLRRQEKKGWVLVYAVLLIHILAIIAVAILSLNSFDFMVDIIFGALWLLFLAYFLFEVRDEFIHTISSKKSDTAQKP